MCCHPSVSDLLSPCPHPPSPRGENVRRVFGMSCDKIGRTVFHQPENGRQRLLLLGENSPVGFCTTAHLHITRPHSSESQPPKAHPDCNKKPGDYIQAKRCEKGLHPCQIFIQAEGLSEHSHDRSPPSNVLFLTALFCCDFSGLYYI